MDSLHKRIEALIPRLRHFARALTRDPEAANELVQVCLLRALSKLHLWQEGNLQAWLFAVMYNAHISMHRRRSAEEPILVVLYDDDPTLMRPPSQESGLMMRDFFRAYQRLSGAHQEVIDLIGVHGMRDIDISGYLGIPRGTVSSRTGRARQLLRQMMAGGMVVPPG